MADEGESTLFALIGSAHDMVLANDDMPEIAVQGDSYAMTVRLTPEILTTLQKNVSNSQMSLSVRLGKTENSFIVNGVSHEMKAFAENPAVCESYVEDEGQFFQVGFVHKKMIVQRDLRSDSSKAVTSAAVEAPKLTTERTSLNSADVDRLTGSKRRRGMRKPLQLAPKRKKPGILLAKSASNPHLSRSSNSSPSKRRSPLPPPVACARSADESEGSSSIGTPLTQSVRTASHPPMSSRSSSPSLSVSKSDCDSKPKPGLKSRHASCQPSLSNRDLPIQDQVVHVLAIAPMTLDGVSRRLSISSRKLEAVVKKVAKFEAPGKYVLRSPYYASVSLQKWPYSSSERAKVQSRIDASGSIGDENTSITSVPLSVSSGEKSEFVKLGTDVGSDTCSHAASALLNEVKAMLGDQNAASNLFRQIVEFKTISSHTDYLMCKHLFEEGYPKYKNIDTTLRKIEHSFADLATSATSAQSSSDRERAEATLIRAYHEIKPVSWKLKDQFEKVHAGMCRLKEMIRDYVSSIAKQS